MGDAAAVGGSAHAVAAFRGSAAVQREHSRYVAGCRCSQRVEAARAALHASLHKVLVIDARFHWNGVGNSLVRWLALLRFGTAAGRATFLWMSDRRSHTEAGEHSHRNVTGSTLSGKERSDLRGRRLQESGKPERGRRRRNELRFERKASQADVFPRMKRNLPNTGDEPHPGSAPVRMYPNSRHAPRGSQLRHVPARPDGFDLGDYFISEGADWRWSRQSRRQVDRALAARGGNASAPLLVTYFCRHHTWACMQPSLEWGPMDMEMYHQLEAANAGAGLDAGYAPGRRGRLDVSHDLEVNGALIAWLASRDEPMVVLRMQHEQTGLEPSAGVAAAVLSGLWQEFGAPALETHTCQDVVDNGIKWPFRGRDTRSAGGRDLWRDVEDQVPLDAWSPFLLAARAASRSKRTFSSRVSKQCDNYAVLRPRRWLQRQMLPYLARLDITPLIVVLHMRTGFADWQFYSRSRKILRDGTLRSRDSWLQAARAAPMPFAQHWQTFESMLLDCKEPLYTPGHPCFTWNSPTPGMAPTAKAASKHCGLRFETPSDGTLAAIVNCASRAALKLRKVLRPATNWSLLVIGDAPGFVSLISALPTLGAIVTNTNEAGVTGHTSFSSTCAQGSRTSCLQSKSVDPGGGWTRSMIDFYLGGLADGFISVLFSSFVGAILGRSLTCCTERVHFGAMYTLQHSHRDRYAGSAEHPLPQWRVTRGYAGRPSPEHHCQANG